MRTSNRILPVATPLFAALLCAETPAQKAPDIRLDSGSPTGATCAYSPQISTSGDTVYVVWEDDRHGGSDLYFNRSLDRGATWLASDVRLATGSAPGASCYGPRAAAAGDAVYVIWDDHRDGNGDIYFQRSLDGGATWLSTGVRLDTGSAAGAAASFGAQMTTAGNAVFVTWTDRRNAPRGPSDIYFNRSLDGGATWLSSDLRLDTGSAPGSATSERPQIAADGTSVWVTWEDDRNDPGVTPRTQLDDIYLNRSVDGGATWLASDIRLDTGSAPGAARSHSPRIAAAGGSVYVTWHDWRNGRPDCYLNRSPDGGATWLPNDVRLDTGTPAGLFDAQDPWIAAEGSAVYVAWVGLLPGQGYRPYFNRSQDGGNTWLTSAICLDDNATSCDNVRLAADGDAVHVAWEDSRNAPVTGATDIRYNRSPDGGTTWHRGGVRVDTGSAPGADYSYLPDIATDGRSVYLTWVDDRSGSCAIYFNIALGCQPYGPDTPGAGGIAPHLAATGLPTLDNTISLGIGNGLGGALGALLIGCGPSSRISMPFQGGTVLVQHMVSIPLMLDGAAGVPAAGSVSVPLQIPGHPSAVGANVNFQAGFVDAGAAAGISLTRGVELWIG